MRPIGYLPTLQETHRDRLHTRYDMAAPPFTPVDFTVEPDLQPLYPTTNQISDLLSPQVGLAPPQKAELVAHCLLRACVFADLSLLSFLLQDPHAQQFVDLSRQDEDELGLISTTVLGFGSESDRDIEREECVRLLVSEGCDVNVVDSGAPITKLDVHSAQQGTSSVQPAGPHCTMPPSFLPQL